jgi:GNAT superfamily N-acetyltransferase
VTPFVILALPRSRTAWLSAFLSYGDVACGHDEVRHWRSLDDIGAWLNQPCTGTVETAAAPFWRLLERFGEVKVATVRRPVPEVVASLQAAMPGTFETGTATAAMRRLDRKLDQLERRRPDVVSVTFDELRTEAGCRRLWEHCMPYPFDAEWYARLAPVNLQVSLPKVLRYFEAHKPQLVKLAKLAERRILADMRPSGPREDDAFDGVTFQAEPFPQVYRDASAALVREHTMAVGMEHDGFNVSFYERLDAVGVLQTMTARCNGRIFGYLVTIVGPSLEGQGITEATHTAFYASPAIKGVGMRLLRAANDALRARGVDIIIMRAGVRGDGPRLGAVYRRLGAEPFGQLYKLKAA